MNIPKTTLNPRRLAEILEECLAERRNDKDLEDEIRHRKAIFIDDIMRVFKLSQIYDNNAKWAINNPSEAFDRLYDCDLDVLEAFLKVNSDKLSAYMSAQVLANNQGLISGQSFWKPFDNNFVI